MFMSEVEMPAMRTIEVVFSDHARRLTIPATWKVTFGAIVPSDKAAASSGAYGWGLRIYEAQDKQRAVFTGVQSFYDISIKQQAAAIRKYGTEDWWLDDGSWTGDRADLVDFQWVDADDVKVGQPPYYNEGLKDEGNEDEAPYRGIRVSGIPSSIRVGKTSRYR